MMVLGINDDEPVATIMWGRNTVIKIYGHADMTPPLVEMVIGGETLNMTVAQAKEISSGLFHAANKAAPKRQ